MPLALNDDEGLERMIRRALGEDDAGDPTSGFASVAGRTVDPDLVRRIRADRAAEQAAERAQIDAQARSAATEATNHTGTPNAAHEPPAHPRRPAPRDRRALRASILAAIRDTHTQQGATP